MSIQVVKTIPNVRAENGVSKIVRYTEGEHVCPKHPHGDSLYLETDNQGGYDGTSICVYCVLDVIREY